MDESVETLIVSLYENEFEILDAWNKTAENGAYRRASLSAVERRAYFQFEALNNLLSKEP